MSYTKRVISSVLLILLFVAGIGGGLVALPMRAAEKKTSWLCLGGTFAGGAFLATALFELGPESLKTLGALPGLVMMVGTMGFLFWLDRQGHHAHAEMHGCHPHGGAGTAAKPYILGGMLGFHSLLEGLALGSVQAGASQEALALAILFHKATDTFALAVTLAKYGLSAGKIFGATVLLSLASPGGAWLASKVDLEGWEMIHGVLAAATCGTFLYLAWFDLLVPELKEREGRLWKSVSAALGFGLVALAVFSGRGS
jgi:zinc transporter ZupT